MVIRSSRILAVILAAAVLFWMLPAAASACSPDFEPTIAKLGPDQVVVVGTTGERVPGGRIFKVSRWFNGAKPVTPILIDFKEAKEAIGDCSYPVSAGTDLIIAPYFEADGRLHANLATLQADPSSEQGQEYIAEAISLFGPGVVPPPAPDIVPAPDRGSGLEIGYLVLALAAGALVVFGMLALVGRQRRRST
jgi:hypothetical protein